MNIIQNTNYYNIDIKSLEKIYQGSYIGDYAIRLQNGKWSDRPFSIFKSLNNNYNNNFFGICIEYKGIPRKTFIKIINADSVFDEYIVGLKTKDNKNILISKYNYDFVIFEDYMLDGGRNNTDTIRCSSKGKIVHLMMNNDGVLKEINYKITDNFLKQMEEEYDN